MTDRIEGIRDDLAFLKAVASDDGRLPSLVGAHFLAAGLIYGLPVLAAWGIERGFIDLPRAWEYAVGLWSTLIYVPVMVLLILRGRRYATPHAAGPTSRAMGAAWSGVGLTTGVILFVILGAARQLHDPELWRLWPAICFALYGAAWWGFATVRRSRAWMLVALGSYATAALNGVVIATPELLLGCGLGLILWVAGPGLALMLKAARVRA
jgi:hypothetical protein